MLPSLTTLEDATAKLQARFSDRIRINARLNRQLVSFQGNKSRPGYRWFRYKEGFSSSLVKYLLDYHKIGRGLILDPFAGAGTTLFAASECGVNATGIELLPVGCEVIQVRKIVIDHEVEVRAALEHWLKVQPWKHSTASFSFPHLRITQGAFPDTTQESLERYLGALEQEPEPVRRVLRFAAMCVLEDVSYTRKDGQYLRWDHRSNRRQGTKPFDKGVIPGFDRAIDDKLTELLQDIQPSGFLPGFFLEEEATGQIDSIQGSCLQVLPQLPDRSFDGLITSPPYANRYDYTRTYALELALLGVTESKIRELRQAMVSCTVENRDKADLPLLFSASTYARAISAIEHQRELQLTLDYLNWLKETKALNNPGIPRMLKNYFLEMALVVFESARLLKNDAPLVMVNDNVRYGGANIPVDLILSDIAEQAGFVVDCIWVLPIGKGNSSQQMGAHGREELRKCIYLWRRSVQ